MTIKYLDLQAQYKNIKEEIDSAIQRVITKQYFILGDEVKAFENEFAAYLECKYAVGVGSGTEGLILALRALTIGPGDEVIVQANSYIASALAITQVGATPVFVDVDEKTYQLDIKGVERKITKKTKAILPVHLYGAPCDMKAILKLAKRQKLFVIEDSAQAHGATIGTKKVGTMGDIGVFSFYPGKNLGAYGDGGCIVTNNEEIYKKLTLLRNYGETKKYYHDTLGVNSRLDEIQAAVLRVKLRHLDSWNNQRNKVADIYNQHMPKIKTQQLYPDTHSIYHIFIVENQNRNELQQYLLEKNISTLIHYPLPIHLQKCYNYLGYKRGDFPVSEALADSILSLPMYAELSIKEVEYIAKTINEYLKI